MSLGIRCNSFDGLDSLVFGNVEIPTIGDHEVLIQVAYAGVNFPDSLIISGKYQFTPELPFSPGQEVSGFVLQKKSDIRKEA